MADFITEREWLDEPSADEINLDYVWESNTGDIHISDMTTTHLNNAIKYLERMYQAIHIVLWKHYLPNIYYNMCAERDKRKEKTNDLR